MRTFYIFTNAERTLIIIFFYRLLLFSFSNGLKYFSRLMNEPLLSKFSVEKKAHHMTRKKWLWIHFTNFTAIFFVHFRLFHNISILCNLKINKMLNSTNIFLHNMASETNSMKCVNRATFVPPTWVTIFPNVVIK